MYTNSSTRVSVQEDCSSSAESTCADLAPANSGLIVNHVSIETHDETILNSQERVVSDRGAMVPNLLMKCRKTTFVSTFNTRSLSLKSRFQELTINAKNLAIDIIAIQEHRLMHTDEELKYHTSNGYQLVTASAWKNLANAATGGVGLLLSPRAFENLIHIDKISDRIVVAEFNGNPKVTVVACYSPHNNIMEDEVDKFYNDLRSVVENIPAHNFLLLLGDFNAKLGQSDVKFSYHTETNRNGEKLTDFMEEFSLFASNTYFMKPINKLWTFEYPTGARAQLDYIICRNKWRNSIKDSRPFSSFSTVGSDHRIVSAKIKLSFRVSKTPPRDPMKNIDWRKVLGDPNISSQYCVDVHNRFQVLSSNDNANEVDDIDALYTKIQTASEEIALSSLPKRQKHKHTPINSADIVVTAREKLKRVSSEYHTMPTRSRKKSLESAKKALDNAYLDAEADYIKGKIADISDLHINQKHSAAWKTINDITGRKTKPVVVTKGGSKQARINIWLSHFKNLLGNPPPLPENSQLPRMQVSEELNISSEPFTMDELTAVLKKTKINKTPGLDKIPPLIWKDPIFHELLLKLCNHTFEHHIPPKIWCKSLIIPIPKKGDLTIPNNYRGISLSPIAAKIYNKLLLNRILPAIDPILRKNQNGFRPGRSTISQVLVLRRIIEEIKRCNREAYLVFVDFRKAFDSIHRETMFEILHLYGIPDAIIEAVKSLYSGSESCVFTSDGITELFSISSGILQGDTLAPLLFIIVLDYVLRTSVDSITDKGLQIECRKSSRHPSKHVTDVDFADDLALVSDNLKNAQALLASLESAANSVGLYLNDDKTEYIAITENEDVSGIQSSSGRFLKRVDDFKYLGSFIMDSTKDFNTRKGMAWSACNKLSKIWESDLPNKIKIDVFQATVEPVLLYGSDTWTLSERLHNRLDGTYTKLLRRVQNISWKEHATLNKIYGCLPRISQTLRQRRAQFAGHCLRATDELSSNFVLWKSHAIGKRSRKLTYYDTICRDTGLQYDDLKTAMNDRATWKEIVYNISAEAAG